MTSQSPSLSNQPTPSPLVIPQPTTRKSAWQNLKAFLQFLRSMNVSLAQLLLPTILTLSSVVFEGLSIGLLIPMLEGMIRNDFTFLQQIPGVQWWFSCLPEAWVQTPLATFFSLVVLILVSTLLTSISGYLSQLATGHAILQAAYQQRSALFSSYLHVGKEFLDHADRGHLSQALLLFSQQLAFFLNHVYRFVVAILQNTLYLFLLLWISWKITISLVILAPILHFSLAWIRYKIEQNSFQQVKARKDMGRFLYNMMENWPLVQVANMVQQEEMNFDRISQKVRHLEWGMEKKTKLVGPFQQVLIQCFLLVLMSVMAVQICYNQAELAGFLVYLYLLRRMAGSMGIWNQFNSSLAQLISPLEEVQNLLRRDDKAIVPDGGRIFEGLTNSIEIRHLTFAYWNQPPILQDWSCVIPKGKITALVGHTGCGKSTLISLLLRFYDVPSQTIFLDGYDIRDFRRDSLYRHISVVSQNIYLFHDTLRANLTYGCGEVPLSRVQELVDKAQLNDLIARLPYGLETELGDHGSPLSGGERQRVALIRALLYPQADIVILDEPTSFLDQATEHIIWKLIQEEFAGRTMLLITHHLEHCMCVDHVVSWPA